MLNIKIERDIDTDEVTRAISYNHSVYDIFTNHAEELSKIVATTALLLINDPLDKTFKSFKSLELQALNAAEATITYNNDRTISIMYDDKNKQFEISRLNIAVTPQYLRILFLSEATVEILPSCLIQN
nr:MAG TPA: hypothetical protein [Caudoviricetes sp.]